jgi:protein-L-isoaspartate(D-aspartate) O-methyltransferase
VEAKTVATMIEALTEARQFYAAYVVGQAKIDDRSLFDAFNKIPREEFCGPGPWKIHTEGGYIETPSDDPRYLYQDILIAIDASRGVNNGQPSLHARSLASVGPRPGERVLHIGAGTGYYSAILAALVGPSGHVEAREIDAHTAARAEQCLAGHANVSIVNRSGTGPDLPVADVIYVNAGTPRVISRWIEALAEGGRLIFPLTVDFQMGGMLLVTRTNGQFTARFTSRAAFIPCLGTEDPKSADALNQAYRGGGWDDVRSLILTQSPDSSCWLEGDGWWLSTRAL